MRLQTIFLSIKIERKEDIEERNRIVFFLETRFIHEFVVERFIEEGHHSINEEYKSIKGRGGRRNHLRKHGGRERERECESGSDAVFRGVDLSRVSISHRHCLASSFRMMVTRVPKETARGPPSRQALCSRHRKQDSLKRDTLLAAYRCQVSVDENVEPAFSAFHALQLVFFSAYILCTQCLLVSR